MNKVAPPVSPNIKCLKNILFLYIIEDLPAPLRPTKKQYFIKYLVVLHHHPACLVSRNIECI